MENYGAIDAGDDRPPVPRADAHNDDARNDDNMDPPPSLTPWILDLHHCNGGGVNHPHDRVLPPRRPVVPRITRLLKNKKDQKIFYENNLN